MEAWADALLDQHRTAPKRDRDPVARLDPMTRMMIEAGAAPMPDLSASRPASTTTDADAWMGKAQAMAFVLVGVLVLGLLLALTAG